MEDLDTVTGAFTHGEELYYLQQSRIMATTVLAKTDAAEMTGQSVDAIASLIACASLSRSDLSRSGESGLRVQPSPA
ncbi:hypothetical protein ACPPVO_32765 [Dactylosporangium sp. McL0621]|uniref:hypothetical protein n=1 Tax=Dactylosporangium sp. McL0621 TaxID=3415678 RepID=UPI003CF090F6